MFVRAGETVEGDRDELFGHPWPGIVNDQRESARRLHETGVRRMCTAADLYPRRPARTALRSRFRGSAHFKWAETLKRDRSAVSAQAEPIF